MIRKRRLRINHVRENVCGIEISAHLLPGLIEQCDSGDNLALILVHHFNVSELAINFNFEISVWFSLTVDFTDVLYNEQQVNEELRKENNELRNALLRIESEKNDLERVLVNTLRIFQMTLC